MWFSLNVLLKDEALLEISLQIKIKIRKQKQKLCETSPKSRPQCFAPNYSYVLEVEFSLTLRD